MSQHDDLTSTLTRELEDRAHTMDDTLLHLTDVRGRARTIRRRRTSGAVAGVAATVALVVPVATFAAHTSGKPEPGPATQTPTQTPTAAPADPQAVLDLKRLPVGARATGGYLAGGEINLADGTTGAIGSLAARVDGFALLSNGTAVYHTRDAGGRTGIEGTDAGGRQHGPYPAGDGLVSDSTRTSAAWVSPAGQVRAWVATHTAPVPVGAPVPGAAWQVSGVVGDCSTSCQVLVRTTDQSTGDVADWLVSSAGAAAQVAPKAPFTTINDVSASGALLGYTHIGAGTSCSAVTDRSGRESWKTCRHTLLAFSPDADHISADVAYHSGDGSSVIAAYDATGGQLLFEHRSTLKTQAVVRGTVWEDDDHLLGLVRQGLDWAVVRFGVDGSMELASPVIRGTDDLTSPIVLGGARG
jgi:hypothetical protein